MATIKQAYVEGFISECQRRGIAPEVLIKSAQGYLQTNGPPWDKSVVGNVPDSPATSGERAWKNVMYLGEGGPNPYRRYADFGANVVSDVSHGRMPAAMKGSLVDRVVNPVTTAPDFMQAEVPPHASPTIDHSVGGLPPPTYFGDVARSNNMPSGVAPKKQNRYGTF